MRRILLFTRHYPPAVSGLAPRTAGLAGALRAAGTEVFVVAPSLPEGEQGLAVPHPNRDPPAQVGPPQINLRALAREVVLWPDPDIRWAMRAARAAAGAGFRADWVLSASPPESAHAAAQWLAKTIGARWAADFTDLWLENPHRLERKRWWRKSGETWFARTLVPKANLAMAVDTTISAELRRFGAPAPEVLSHFHVAGTAAHVSLPAERINIVCTGSFTLSAPENVIDPLLHAFESALARNPALMLHIVGRLTDAERAAFASSPAATSMKVHGVVPHAQALGFQAAADALAFACPPKLHVPPSKIVEYLALDKPIIACGEGPWRGDPRVPPGDPADAMATLKKGDRRQAGLPSSQTAQEAAQRLMALMDAREGAR